MPPAAYLNSAVAAAAAAVEELPHDDQGQLLRPGVVWFNENLDDAVIDRIEDELDEADLLLIIGEGIIILSFIKAPPETMGCSVRVCWCVPAISGCWHVW